MSWRFWEEMVELQIEIQKATSSMFNWYGWIVWKEMIELSNQGPSLLLHYGQMHWFTMPLPDCILHALVKHILYASILISHDRHSLNFKKTKLSPQPVSKFVISFFNLQLANWNCICIQNVTNLIIINNNRHVSDQSLIWSSANKTVRVNIYFISVIRYFLSIRRVREWTFNM